VFDISMMVMQYINANPSVRGYMTRVDDSAVTLGRRAEIANSIGADLFISIHANAAANRNANGIETWYIIGDLELEGNHLITSHELAAIMQASMLRHTGANDRGLRVGPNLVVNRDTSMPSALLEVGFLSNYYESALLGTVEYQRILARAIYEGILEALALIASR